MYFVGDEEIEAIENVVRSMKLFRFQGPNMATECQMFEEELAAQMGVKHAVLLTSGTNALVASLKAAGIGAGDEVIIPSYTFFATAAAVVSVKAVPIIVNIDETLSMSPKELKAALSPKTKAVIPVHMDGRPCDLEKISAICCEHNLVLIEDAAQAIGGSFNGKRLGSVGEFGCFSFNQDKIISAGEGGALICNDPFAYKRAQNIHDACCPFGATLKETFDKDKVVIGGSMRVSEITGAMLRVQLKRLDSIIARLKKNQLELEEALKGEGFKLAPKNCSEGDCGTSVMVSFPDAQQALKSSQEWAKKDLKSFPISIRPAHAVWQWVHLLRHERFASDAENPFRYSDRKAQEIYHPLHFHETVELLTRTIKLQVPFEEAELARWIDIMRV